MTAKKKHTTASKVAAVVSIPGYEIKDLLGRGGMAMVYLAIQKSIGREVALKVLSPDHSDETFSERFLREARIASQLSHPNIITVYDAGIHNGIHYMSMEYIKGKSFNEARDLLTRKQKVIVIKQIAQALDFASKKGFLHRDIKPENILLHQDGRAILTDFGIAKKTDVAKGLTETGKVLGTPYFMSPEQTKGLQIDHRTDIYSLGVVLFQALAGYVPYDGPSLVAICIKHLSDPIPQLPKGLEIFQPIINTCMSKKPEHRYQHASELFNALNKITESQLDFIDNKTEHQKQNSHLHSDYNSATMVDPIKSLSSEKQTSNPNKIKSVTHTISPSRKYIKADNNSFITDSDDFKNLNRRKSRLFILLLILASATGYYKKDELKDMWKNKGIPLANQYLPVAVKQIIFKEEIDTKIANSLNTPKPIPLTAQQIEHNKIRNLWNTIDKIPSNAEELAKIYKQKIIDNPNDIKTIAINKELKQWYLTRSASLITKKEFDTAEKFIATIITIYPETAHSDEITSLNDKLHTDKINEPHLQKSRVYFAVNALNIPKGANALGELKIVLKNDPANTEALEGLSRIVDYFKNKANEQIKNKEYFKALNSTNSGLQAIHNNVELLQLQKIIKSAINNKNYIKERLLKADNQLTAGYSTSSKDRDESAYDIYQQILKLDVTNKSAKKGLLLIKNKLTKDASTALKLNKFKEASEIITTASRLYNNNSEINILKIKLKKEMDAVLPIIPKIKISTSPFLEINQTTLQKIKVGQLLHIGFEYNNFTHETTNIKVFVYNGQLQSINKQKQIIQKSITIAGNSGKHYFTVQLPKTGIINGDYAIELKLGDSRLIKASLHGLH